METYNYTGLVSLTKLELESIESKPISFDRIFGESEDEAEPAKAEVILVSPSSIASVEAQGLHSKSFSIVTMKELHNGEHKFYKVNESIAEINALINEMYANAPKFRP